MSRMNALGRFVGGAEPKPQNVEPPTRSTRHLDRVRKLKEGAAARDLKTGSYWSIQQAFNEQRDAIGRERAHTHHQEETHGRSDATRKALADLDAEWAAAQRAYESAIAESQADTRITSLWKSAAERAEKQVRSVPAGTVVEEVLVDLPQDITEATIREKIHGVDSSITDNLNADLPPEEVKKDMKAEIASKAEGVGWEPGYGEGTAGKIVAPVKILAHVHTDERTSPKVPDAMALVCHYFPKQVEAEVNAQIDAYYERVSLVLTSAEKTKRLRELRAERIDLERQLAEVIWRRIDNGDSTATFPETMSAKAILGIA